MAETAPATVETHGIDEELVRRISGNAGESAGLLAVREEALSVFRETPMPDRVRHLWRFTNPAKLVPGEIRSPMAPVPVDESLELPGASDVAVLAPTADSFRIRLSEAAAAAGVRMTSMAEDGEILQDLGTVVPAGMGYFEALNLAAYTAGITLDIPANTRLEEPIRIVVPAVAGAYLPRILVRAGTNSECTVLEEHLGGGTESRMVSVTEIVAAPASRVTHVVFQHWNEGARGHATVRSRVRRDAKVTLVVVSMGGEVTKMNLGSILSGRGAQSEIGGVVLGARRQHMDHHTLHDHRAPDTLSNIDFKVALTGRARSAYTGLIRIATDAPGTEAYQENRNLLLSAGSRADTIPELEILTDDVQCTHGATVAPMDDEQVFYLESRGIPPMEARRLIVQGFLEAALSRLPEGLRGELEPGISAGLSDFLGEGDGR